MFPRFSVAHRRRIFELLPDNSEPCSIHIAYDRVRIRRRATHTTVLQSRAVHNTYRTISNRRSLERLSSISAASAFPSESSGAISSPMAALCTGARRPCTTNPLVKRRNISLIYLPYSKSYSTSTYSIRVSPNTVPAYEYSQVQPTMRARCPNRRAPTPILHANLRPILRPLDNTKITAARCVTPIDLSAQAKST